MDRRSLFINVIFAVHWLCGNVESSTFASHATAVSLASISVALDRRIAPLGYLTHQMGRLAMASFLAALHAPVVMSQTSCMQVLTTVMIITMQTFSRIIQFLLMMMAIGIACSEIPSAKNPD
jgi:hypothetical protein